MNLCDSCQLFLFCFEYLVDWYFSANYSVYLHYVYLSFREFSVLQACYK